MISTGSEVKSESKAANQVTMRDPQNPAAGGGRQPGSGHRPPIHILLSFPLAILLAFPVHLGLAAKQTVPESRSYSVFLGILLAFALVSLASQSLLPAFRRW